MTGFIDRGQDRLVAIASPGVSNWDPVPTDGAGLFGGEPKNEVMAAFSSTKAVASKTYFGSLRCLQ